MAARRGQDLTEHFEYPISTTKRVVGTAHPMIFAVYFRFMIFFLLIFFVGCSTPTPKYVSNWDKLEKGMTRDEVKSLLGISPVTSYPVETADPFSYLTSMLLFPDWSYERWEYGKFDVFESILFPSDNAYVVYFNNTGKVVKWRKPIAHNP